MDGSFVIYTAVVIPLFKFALLFCLEFFKVVEFWFLSFPFFYKKNFMIELSRFWWDIIGILILQFCKMWYTDFTESLK